MSRKADAAAGAIYVGRIQSPTRWSLPQDLPANIATWSDGQWKRYLHMFLRVLAPFLWELKDQQLTCDCESSDNGCHTHVLRRLLAERTNAIPIQDSIIAQYIGRSYWHSGYLYTDRCAEVVLLPPGSVGKSAQPVTIDFYEMDELLGWLRWHFLTQPHGVAAAFQKSKGEYVRKTSDAIPLRWRCLWHEADQWHLVSNANDLKVQEGFLQHLADKWADQQSKARRKQEQWTLSQTFQLGHSFREFVQTEHPNVWFDTDDASLKPYGSLLQQLTQQSISAALPGVERDQLLSILSTLLPNPSQKQSLLAHPEVNSSASFVVWPPVGMKTGEEQHTPAWHMIREHRLGMSSSGNVCGLHSLIPDFYRAWCDGTAYIFDDDALQRMKEGTECEEYIRFGLEHATQVLAAATGRKLVVMDGDVWLPATHISLLDKALVASTDGQVLGMTPTSCGKANLEIKYPQYGVYDDRKYLYGIPPYYATQQTGQLYIQGKRLSLFLVVSKTNQLSLKLLYYSPRLAMSLLPAMCEFHYWRSFLPSGPVPFPAPSTLEHPFKWCDLYGRLAQLRVESCLHDVSMDDILQGFQMALEEGRKKRPLPE